MKKQARTKMKLARETIRVLGQDTLDNVAGGTSVSAGPTCSLSHNCTPYPSYNACTGLCQSGGHRCY